MTLADAHALFRQGRLAEAETACRAVTAREAGNAAAFDLLGLIVFQTGRREEGLRLVETALRLAPANATALGHLGTMKNIMGDLVAAESALRRATNLSPTDANAHLNLGSTLVRLGDAEHAAESFRTALALAPGNAAARLNLAHLAADQGQFADAVREYETLLAREPKNTAARLGLARALLALDRPHDALAQIDAVSGAPAQGLGAQRMRASALEALGRNDEAVTVLAAASRVAPANAGVCYEHARLLYRAGHLQEALRRCETHIAAQGGNMDLFALIAFLYNEAGNAERRDHWLDFGAIREGRLRAPDGYRDAGQFLDRLLVEVQSHPTLKHAPANHATRYGKHSGELFTGSPGALGELERQVRAALDDYADSAQLPDEPAYRRLKPARYKIAAWSVIMESQGHQVAHNHPSAWISGVTYLQVPDVIEREADAKSGWIEFGMPPGNFGARAEPCVRCFKPERGKFFLFPSYYYHRTIPFHSDTLRICIAFDAVPVA